MRTGAPLWHRDEDHKRGIPEGEHGQESNSTGNKQGKRGKVMPSGLHHMAIICKVSFRIQRFRMSHNVKRPVFAGHGGNSKVV